MTSISFQIRDLLVKAGHEEKDAEIIASEIMTKTEAQQTLATKTDMEVLKTRVNMLIGINIGVFVAVIVQLLGTL